MRIAVVTTSYPTRAGDPAGHFVESDARALSRAGHRVVVFAPGEKARREPGNPELNWLASGESFGAPGVLARLRQSPGGVGGIVRFVFSARRALARRGPFDRVVAHWLVPCAWPIAAGSPAAELECVAHGSDVRLLEMLPEALRRRALAPLTRGGAWVRCVSHDLASRLVLLEPGLAGRLRVAPSSIDVSAALPREAARQELHADGRKLCVVVARLIESKRLEVALGALALLGGVRIVVIGDGPLREPLVERYPDVEFVGQLPRERCLSFIAAADLLLSASKLEGAPTCIREARALGTSVVSARAGDVPIWADTDAGLLALAE